MECWATHCFQAFGLVLQCYSYAWLYITPCRLRAALFKEPAELQTVKVLLRIVHHHAETSLRPEAAGAGTGASWHAAA